MDTITKIYNGKYDLEIHKQYTTDVELSRRINSAIIETLKGVNGIELMRALKNTYGNLFEAFIYNILLSTNIQDRADIIINYPLISRIGMISYGETVDNKDWKKIYVLIRDGLDVFHYRDIFNRKQWSGVYGSQRVLDTVPLHILEKMLSRYERELFDEQDIANYMFFTNYLNLLQNQERHGLRDKDMFKELSMLDSDIIIHYFTMVNMKLFGINLIEYIPKYLHDERLLTQIQSRKPKILDLIYIDNIYKINRKLLEKNLDMILKNPRKSFIIIRDNPDISPAEFENRINKLL